jgi:capsular polysaccharide biosynthesis protein
MDRDSEARNGLAIAPLAVIAILFVLFALFAVALSSQLRYEAPEASFRLTLEPDWGGRWETGVKGVKFIPLYVTPPHRVVVSFARDVESPAIAEEVIRRLGLRMTPDELLENLTVEPDPESADGIRLTYRDPSEARETPRRARRIVSTVVVVAVERIRKEVPCRCAYDYTWGLP